MWHIPPGKRAFEKGKLWKVVRRVVKLEKRGAPRLLCILRLARKDVESGALTKHPREEDMVKRVLGVMAAVSSRFPLSVFNNSYFRLYTTALDPMHRPPHHLEINRIIEVLVDAAYVEFLRIVNERRDFLGYGFMSLSSDFVTDSVRRESYGVILVELVAEKYELEDGRTLYMSRETADKICNQLLSVSLIIICCFCVLFIHVSNCYSCTGTS